ncbi:hypothetical protein [Gimesia fumaroli]|uniref:Xylose isomerase-like TIM barrel n=1 Tax=Gimesia fumaroli TaxID=2527976 RepID=A0A518I914_9PLAN|nr:hypothetical protein [Gimesia fumaroli]QDV49590.1 hypothetical protein Enr17x_16100 [Gimesia fumaroli]
MPLNCVTITGADDRTNVQDLIELSKEFPFVEWGILIGTSTGQRFPSYNWIHELAEAKVESGLNINLSLHLCGGHLREVTSGRSYLHDHLGNSMFVFQRVQLNFHGEKQGPDCSEKILNAFCKIERNCFGWDPTIIFQLDGVNYWLYEAAERRFAVCGLFDRSHGAGVVPNEWPKARTDIQTGWAGGLGPDNLAEELPKIDSQALSAMNYWIDMETQVRTDEVLDLEKVSQCLKIAGEFMAFTK